MAKVYNIHHTQTFNVPVNHLRSTDPTPTDDATKGFNPGDNWFNTATDYYFQLIRNDPGNASWQLVWSPPLAQPVIDLLNAKYPNTTTNASPWRERWR
jgi:hypothetical protein